MDTSPEAMYDYDLPWQCSVDDNTKRIIYHEMTFIRKWNTSWRVIGLAAVVLLTLTVALVLTSWLLVIIPLLLSVKLFQVAATKIPDIGVFLKKHQAMANNEMIASLDPSDFYVMINDKQIHGTLHILYWERGGVFPPYSQYIVDIYDNMIFREGNDFIAFFEFETIADRTLCKVIYPCE